MFTKIKTPPEHHRKCMKMIEAPRSAKNFKHGLKFQIAPKLWCEPPRWCHSSWTASESCSKCIMWMVCIWDIVLIEIQCLSEIQHYLKCSAYMRYSIHCTLVRWVMNHRIRCFYTLLFHSLFKVKFDIDHFVLGEHRER